MKRTVLPKVLFGFLILGGSLFATPSSSPVWAAGVRACPELPPDCCLTRRVGLCLICTLECA